MDWEGHKSNKFISPEGTTRQLNHFLKNMSSSCYIRSYKHVLHVLNAHQNKKETNKQNADKMNGKKSTFQAKRKRNRNALPAGAVWPHSVGLSWHLDKEQGSNHTAGGGVSPVIWVAIIGCRTGSRSCTPSCPPGCNLAANSTYKKNAIGLADDNDSVLKVSRRIHGETLNMVSGFPWVKNLTMPQGLCRIPLCLKLERRFLHIQIFVSDEGYCAEIVLLILITLLPWPFAFHVLRRRDR